MENGHINKLDTQAWRQVRRPALSLKESTSVSRFESTAIDTFAADLTQSLQSVLGEHSCRSGRLVKYDVEKLQCLFMSEIDWMALLSQYDRHVKTSTAIDTEARPTSTTPLDLVLQALTENPTSFPMACFHIVINVGWQQIIYYCAQPRLTSLRKDGEFLTRAQEHVWFCLLRLARKSRSAWKQVTFPRVDSHSTSVLRQYETLFRMLQQVRQQQCWSDRIVLDAALRLLRQSQPFVSVQDSTITDPQTIPIPLIKNKYNPYEASHDDDLHIDPDEVGLPKLPIAFRERKEASLSQILQQDTKTIEAKTRGSIVVDLEKWREWRERVFDFAISSASSRACMNRTIPDQIWSIILEKPEQSSLLRFFLLNILVVEPQLLQEWMHKLLQFAKMAGRQTCRSVVFAMQFYSELVVELAAFDDLALLQSITAPLFEYLLDEQNIGDGVGQLSAWKRVFVCLLSRRSNWLNAIPHFESLKTTISLVYGSVHDWIYPSMSEKERSYTITALYQAGVLGVCDAMEHAAELTKLSNADILQGRWPFAKLNGIRMASWNCRKLSHSKHYFSRLESGRVARLGAPKSDPSKVRDFVQNFLHGDILLRVFDYLGFKRIAQVHLVCKDWKDLADHSRLWGSFYESRYGISADDPVRNNPDQPWKTFFHHRFIAEREVRSRGSTSARKLRVCKFVGCNTIVSTPLQLARHHTSHQKQGKERTKKTGAKKEQAGHKRKRTPPKRTSPKRSRKMQPKNLEQEKTVNESCRS